ncbi:MAG TPA: outer membrane beta-barrel protein [Steroidobacteraceae bacterium]|nr:outer membrane beta-barrel protein [Steroidobacteraceae bacterium]
MSQETLRGVRATLVGALGLSVFVVGAADAADYRFEPRVELGGMYNDNYRLAPDNEDSVQGGLADVSLRLRSVTPTSDFNLTPRVRATYFPDDSEDDDVNEYVNLGFAHKAQTWRFGLEGYYSHEDLQTSEQPEADQPPDAGLGGGVGVENGTVRVKNSRDLIRLAPSVSFDLTPTKAVEAALEYYSADYSRDTVGSNTDFDSIAGSLGMSFRFSPTQRILIAATGTSFDPDTPLTGRSTSYGLKGELWTDRTEIMQTYLRIGAERTEEDDPEIGEAPDPTTNYVLGAGIKAQYQVTAIFADFTHGVRPNASGVLVTRDDLRVQVRREFTPTVSGFVGVLGANDEAANDDGEFRDRRYYAGSAGLQWRFTPAFSLVGAYDYRRQKRDQEGTGVSNQVVLSIVWDPPRRQ